MAVYIQALRRAGKAASNELTSELKQKFLTIMANRMKYPSVKAFMEADLGKALIDMLRSRDWTFTNYNDFVTWGLNTLKRLSEQGIPSYSIKPTQLASSEVAKAVVPAKDTVMLTGATASHGFKGLTSTDIERVRALPRNTPIVIGDEPTGADKAFQDLLKKEGFTNVTVYYAGNKPRYLAPGFKAERVDTSGTTSFIDAQRMKDKKMLEIAEYVLPATQTGPSSRLYAQQKPLPPSAAAVRPAPAAKPKYYRVTFPRQMGVPKQSGWIGVDPTTNRIKEASSELQWALNQNPKDAMNTLRRTILPSTESEGEGLAIELMKTRPGMSQLRLPFPKNRGIEYAEPEGEVYLPLTTLWSGKSGERALRTYAETIGKNSFGPGRPITFSKEPKEGTGEMTPADFGRRIAQYLEERSGIPPILPVKIGVPFVSTSYLYGPLKTYSDLGRRGMLTGKAKNYEPLYIGVNTALKYMPKGKYKGIREGRQVIEYGPDPSTLEQATNYFLDLYGAKSNRSIGGVPQVITRSESTAQQPSLLDLIHNLKIRKNYGHGVVEPPASEVGLLLGRDIDPNEFPDPAVLRNLMNRGFTFGEDTEDYAEYLRQLAEGVGEPQEEVQSSPTELLYELIGRLDKTSPYYTDVKGLISKAIRNEELSPEEVDWLQGMVGSIRSIHDPTQVEGRAPSLLTRSLTPEELAEIDQRVQNAMSRGPIHGEPVVRRWKPQPDPGSIPEWKREVTNPYISQNRLIDDYIDRLYSGASEGSLYPILDVLNMIMKARLGSGGRP